MRSLKGTETYESWLARYNNWRKFKGPSVDRAEEPAPKVVEKSAPKKPVVLQQAPTRYCIHIFGILLPLFDGEKLTMRDEEFWAHVRRKAFWLRIRIFLVIILYEAVIAAVVAAPVYFFASPSAAWWTFWAVFGVMTFYGINREFGPFLAVVTIFAVIIGVFAIA